MHSLIEIVLYAIRTLENKNKLTPIILRQLAENLIKEEIKPGGPYSVWSQDSIFLNVNILKLFTILNKSLPKVEIYLRNSMITHKEKFTPEITNIISEIEHIKKNQLSPASRKMAQKERYNFYSLYCEKLTPEVRKIALTFGEKVARADEKYEITNISYEFQNSFIWGKFSDHEIETLGDANFIVWVAYSIYDSIIDKDIDPGAVSAANIILRMATSLYYSMNIDMSIANGFTSRVDNANAWEVTHCRFTQTRNKVVFSAIPEEANMEVMLSDRAIAHIIGPLCITSRESHKDLIQIEFALKYYCIARQLNDDLHDWVEDFNNGRISFVLARLLRNAKVSNSIYNKTELMPTLKKIFYDSELELSCRLLESYIDKSIELLTEVGMDKNNAPFIKKILEPIRDSSIQARQIHLINKSSVSNFY